MQMSEFQKNLKESTLKSHKDAENHPIMQSFIKGDFKKKNLLKFLANVRSLYYVVEQRLLQPYIVNNDDLYRTSKIDKDIELLKKNFSADELAEYLTPFECTDLWVAWCWSKPKYLLKGDLYVRWLADLYGGRIMAKSLGAYNNTNQFTDPGTAMKTIRDILESTTDKSEQDDIVNEAEDSFTYHIDLFNKIQEND